MAKLFAGIRTSGKKSEDHDDDEDEAKRAEEHEDDEDKEAQDDEDEDDEKESKSAKAARRAAAKTGKKARVEARQIVETCTLAGKPELAAEFLAKGVSLADVRKSLLKQQASESSATNIAGQNGPSNGAVIDTAAIYAKYNNPKQARAER